MGAGQSADDIKNAFKVPAEGGALQLMEKDEDEQVELELTEKTKLTHDTYNFKFGFPNQEWTFGLGIGQHVIFNAQIDGEEVCRKYTPVSPIDQKGSVDFVIKIYRKNVHPRFPDGGKMTQYLESLEVGAKMKMEGPKGRLIYHGCGDYTIKKQEVKGKSKVGLVAGGTGITPVYQVMQAGLINKDQCSFSLLFGNQTVNDILLRKEIEEYSEKHAEFFRHFFTVDRAPEDGSEWNQGVGFITADMLKEKMPEPSPETLILFCGPPPFEKMMEKHLADLGYTEDMWYKF